MEIVIRENGEMVGVGYNSNANAWFRTHGPVPPEDPTRKAMEGWQALEELAASEHCTMDAPQVIDCADEDGYLAIEIRLLAVPPPEPVGVSGCPVCGAAFAYIRGKHPGEDQREVCPTCLQERMDDIRDRLDPNYGVACQENDDGKD